MSASRFFVCLTWHIVAYLTLSAAAPQSPQSPNIIFMVVDDWGYGDMAFQSSEINTPNLDQLYKQSISLDYHYGEVLCTPSRAQLLTGRYAFNLGVAGITFGYARANAIPAGVPTVAQLLKEYANYNTYMVGKWHLGYAAKELTPLMRGFDQFYGFYGAGINYNTKTVSAIEIDEFDGSYIDWFKNWDIDYDTQLKFSTSAQTDYVVSILQEYSTNKKLKMETKQEKEDPFFMYLSWQAAHVPLTEVTEYASQCSMISTDSSLGSARYKYCTNLLAVDNAMGTIMQSLQSTSLWEDTIVVITNDNGGKYSDGGCNYPLRGDKGSYFEGGVRLRAFVTGGSNIIAPSQQGTSRQELFHQSDWLPTLLGVANIEVQQVSHDLSRKVYNNNNQIDVFDGYDMSNYLLNNDITSHKRYNVPLTVTSDFNSNNLKKVSSSSKISRTSKDNALVFKSSFNSHVYKYLYLSSDKITQQYAGYCSFDSSVGSKISHTAANYDSYEMLYDLSSDTRETANLLDDEERPEGVSFELVKNLLKEARMTLMGYNGEGESSSGKSSGKNDLFNDVLSCQFDTYYVDDADPSNFDDSWQPFFTWGEYVQAFEDTCKSDVNDLLFGLYTKTYEVGSDSNGRDSKELVNGGSGSEDVKSGNGNGKNKLIGIDNSVWIFGGVVCVVFLVVVGAFCVFRRKRFGKQDVVFPGTDVSCMSGVGDVRDCVGETSPLVMVN